MPALPAVPLLPGEPRRVPSADEIDDVIAELCADLRDEVESAYWWASEEAQRATAVLWARRMADRIASGGRDSFESAKLTTGEFNEP